MSNVKRLVYSIIQFLGDQLHSGNLSPDAAESLEVAIQCLEQAYSINHDDVTSVANLQATQPLLEIFNAATQNQQHFRANKEVSPEVKTEAEKLKNEGNEFMKAENYRTALECYSKAIKLDSSNAIYYCNRAAAYNKLGNHQMAIADCEKAIQIDNEYSKAYGRKGLAHSNLGQHEEARKCYEKAMQLDPENESYLNSLRIAEEKLRETNLGSQGASAQSGSGMFGLESGALNFSLFNNPTLMNMATQMMSDPNMQQFLGNLLSGNVQSSNSNNPPGVQDLLQAGQQLAAHMEASNPELVEQLRRQMQMGNSPRNPNQNSPGDDSSSK